MCVCIYIYILVFRCCAFFKVLRVQFFGASGHERSPGSPGLVSFILGFIGVRGLRFRFVSVLIFGFRVQGFRV